MTLKNLILVFVLVGSAPLLAAQDLALPTTDTTEVVATDSLHEEFYEVAPAIEFVPGDEPPGLLEDRLSCIDSDFPLTYNKTVHSFIDYFTIRDREFTKSILRRKDLYFPIFEKYLAQYNLPDDLKYLSIIESGLVPTAVSKARAVGLWQFMSSTGKHFGLHNNWYWDDRMDPEKSTDAACRYLAELYRIFKDWPLALAAYNSGPGTVLKANRRSGYKNDFWKIYPYLPRETRAYVPQFIAMVYTMKYAENHNFYEPHGEKFIPSDTITVSSYLNLDVFSNLTGTCREDLRQLNPQLLTAALPDNDRVHVLRIPVGAKENLLKNKASILDSASKSGKSAFESLARELEEKQYIYYKVKSGNSLGYIASRYGVKIDDLKAWNGLRKNMIHPGQMLKIMVSPSRVAAAKTKSQTIPAKPGSVYVVQPGDTLWDIAKNAGVSIEKIKSSNGLSGNNIAPGQKLILR
ncbi:MAG: LysM peptidoglycan-binding domain-containing protein [Bacteroidetes bacterium]|nr:LysM peptidoglycan-binding domain-containing protein [Bacteroidota bacterium]